MAAASFLMLCLGVSAQSDRRVSFNDGWTFSLNGGDSECVTLPHDWAIRGQFDWKNPSGTGGGALPGGLGVYRKTFTVRESDRNKLFRLDFDGVYMNASLYVNDRLVGNRPYGYVSFGFDITPYIHRDGTPNTIEVRVDNTEQPNSRWYSGCGIYRNVWLTLYDGVHFAQDGVQVTYEIDDIKTPDIKGVVPVADKVKVKVRATVVNETDEACNLLFACDIIPDSTDFDLPFTSESDYFDIGSHDTLVIEKTLLSNKPIKLWDTDSASLYNALFYLGRPERLIPTQSNLDSVAKYGDSYLAQYELFRLRTGFRTAEFRPDGFYLNGEKMQIQGVCMHHDLGCLGAAVNRRAIQRQLEILRGMGINGIRCSHNPPAPELLDLCDEMGFLVMDEAFDMWRKKKTAHDYARYFNEWHERDLNDFVLRDRNHPSIVIWSIGNEVLEQWTDANADTLSLEQANLLLNFGHSSEELAAVADGKDDGSSLSVNALLTRKLVGMVKCLDDRPITSGCNEPNEYNHLFKSGALDVIGFNYHNQNIPDVPSRFPCKPFIITESNSALMTRGYYRMPSDSMYIFPKRWDLPFADESFACSSYENCHVPWGNTNEENLLLMRRYPWICGQFVWTGFDYIGEPTPYGWPARSSYFGIVDLAGFPKDVYYLYKAELTTDTVLHVFPHWTWSPEQLPADGMIDLWAYYNNADEVELYVNGKSQGTRHKTDSCLHTVWRVHYEPGEVVAVSRLRGKEVKRTTIRTAGEPSQIRLSPDRSVIAADGKDLSFVTVEVLDKDGNLCPWADNLIEFSVTGPAVIAGVDNGSQTSLESFVEPHRHAFYGKCLVVLRNNGRPSTAELSASAAGLKGASIGIVSK